MAKLYSFSREQGRALQGKSLEEKIELVKTWFTPAEVKEIIAELKYRELKRQQRALPKVDPAETNAKKRRETEITNKKTSLDKMKVFLYQKMAVFPQEAPTEADAEKLQQLLTMPDYEDMRDDYIKLLTLCFNFDSNPVKRVSAFFIDNLMKNGIVEPSIIFSLLEGGYISRKTYYLLKKHQEIIKKQQWDKYILPILQNIFSLGGCRHYTKAGKKIIPFTEEKKVMIEDLIKIYSTPAERSTVDMISKIPEGATFEMIAAINGEGD